VSYNRKSGFLGHLVKEEPDISFSCSEYDKLLLIFKNGMYKVINVVEKLFVGNDLYWVGKVEEKTIFNIIYREGSQNLSYIKRLKTPKFILEKEYNLFPEHKKSYIELMSLGKGSRVRIYFVPSRRAKSNIYDYLFDDFLVKGAGAIGKRISTRVIRRIVEIGPEEPSQKKEPESLSLFEKT
ncbi:MAG: DNA topoisomerase IV subunit A, partial [Desulfobulbaceae bacterium]|nr:DNA topoisomerase IV subunit A [Desulfobulbaceae bacterium]